MKFQKSEKSCRLAGSCKKSGKEGLPFILESVLDLQDVPEGLRTIAEQSEPERTKPRLSQENDVWCLNYKGWKVVYSDEPIPSFKDAWIKIIDQGGLTAWDGQKTPLIDLSETKRPLCECGQFGDCYKIVLRKR